MKIEFFSECPKHKVHVIHLRSKISNFYFAFFTFLVHFYILNHFYIKMENII